VAWFAKVVACAVAGLCLGFVVEKIVMLMKKVF